MQRWGDNPPVVDVPGLELDFWPSPIPVPKKASSKIVEEHRGTVWHVSVKSAFIYFLGYIEDHRVHLFLPTEQGTL